MKNLREFVRATVREVLRENLEDSDIIAYHGTNHKFDIFNNEAPIFFVDDINVAKTYGDFVIKARLSIDNPIEVDFENNSTYYFIDKWYLPSEFAKKIKEIADDLKNQYMLDDETQEELDYLGFNKTSGDIDGIIMKNISDAYDMFSNHKPAINYVIFDKNQIKKAQLLK